MEQRKASILPSIVERCTDRGLRITRLRRRLLEILANSDRHLDANRIHELMRDDDTGSNLSSIYRNLEVLESIGIVRACNFRSHSTCYELARESETHDHLIDLDSGRIIDLPEPEFQELKAKIARQYGYTPQQCRIEIYAGAGQEGRSSRPAIFSPAIE